MAARVRASVVDGLSCILTSCFGVDGFTITAPDTDGFATITLHGRNRTYTDTVKGLVNVGMEDCIAIKLDKRTVQVR